MNDDCNEYFYTTFFEKQTLKLSYMDTLNRTDIRINRMIDCSTLEEFVNDIFPHGMDDISISRVAKRELLTKWVTQYKSGSLDASFRSRTPKDMMEDIYKPDWDDNTQLFQRLRSAGIKWIENFCKEDNLLLQSYSREELEKGAIRDDPSNKTYVDNKMARIEASQTLDEFLENVVPSRFDFVTIFNSLKRESLRKWILQYKSNSLDPSIKFKTPEDKMEDVCKPSWDYDAELYNRLRASSVKWIENFCNNTK